MAVFNHVAWFGSERCIFINAIYAIYAFSSLSSLSSMLERLQKILSRYGIASRREAEQMILAGRVQVNGIKIIELGTRADPSSDRIAVDGKILAIAAPKFIYLLLHKPLGIVCTCDDPQGRKTVIDILPPQYQHLYPVGRLDYHSSGALILTNDGEFANQMMHPRHHVPKTYSVWVRGIPSDRILNLWRTGVMLDGKITKPAIINEIENLLKVEQDCTHLQITISEGRNRQIRRIAEQLGHPVSKLHRLAIADIHLDQLRSGQYRLLTNQEVLMLKKQ